jgi:hypothetical protein
MSGLCNAQRTVILNGVKNLRSHGCLSEFRLVLSGMAGTHRFFLWPRDIDASSFPHSL